jgi:hypothetical protein
MPFCAKPTPRAVTTSNAMERLLRLIGGLLP